MQIKKVSLVIALSSLVLLSGCNNNVGDDSDNTRVGNNSYSLVAQTSKNTASTQAAGDQSSFKNYALGGIVNSFLSGGIFAIPGNIFTSWLTDLMVGGKADPSVQILEKLEQIQNTLDKMTLQLKKTLDFNDTTLRKLDTFMKDYKTDQFDLSFQDIDKQTKDIRSKYNMFNIQQVFDKNLTVQDQEKLFKLAQQNCDNKGILSVLDANRRSINGVIKVQSSGVPETEQLFGQFEQTFIDKNSIEIGGIWGQFEKRRAKYLDASFSTVYANEDKMDYINYYNYQAAKYAATIYASYQELYNMQLAQITYNYACNTNISLDNLKLDYKESGFDGYLNAVKELNKTYNSNFTLLSENISKYMRPIDNAEITKLINDKLFGKTGVQLLEIRNFGVNPQKNQECTISNLTINLQDGTDFGMANLVARCIVNTEVSGNKVKIKTAFAHQSIPFIRKTDAIARVGVYNIYTRPLDSVYVPETNSADMTFSVNGSQFSDEDISNFIGDGHNDISDMDHFDYMQAFTYPTYFKKAGGLSPDTSKYYWKAATLSVSKDTYLFPHRGIQHYAYQDHPYSNYDGNVFPAPFSNTFTFTSGYDGDIIQKSKMKENTGLGKGNHQFAQWYLATTHGMIYTIKIHSLHYGDNEGDLRDSRYYSNGNVIGQVVGIGCLYNVDYSCEGVKNGVISDTSVFGVNPKRNLITLKGVINSVTNDSSGGNGAFSIDATNPGQTPEEVILDR